MNNNFNISRERLKFLKCVICGADNSINRAKKVLKDSEKRKINAQRELNQLLLKYED